MRAFVFVGMTTELPRPSLLHNNYTFRFAIYITIFYTYVKSFISKKAAVPYLEALDFYISNFVYIIVAIYAKSDLI